MLLNKARALEAMRQYQLDAIIATTPENVTYLTDFAGWRPRVYKGNTPMRGVQSYAILSSDPGAGATLVIPIAEATYLASHALDVPEVWTFGGERGIPEDAQPARDDIRRFLAFAHDTIHNRSDPGTALIDALRSHKLTRGRIALETLNLAPGVGERLRDQLPEVEFVEAGYLLRYIRYVKTPAEVQRLRQAARVNENAVQAVIDTIRPGVTEIEMRRAYKTALAQQDAEFEFFNCPAGPRVGVFFPPSEYRLQPGDHGMFDGGCIYNFYHADTGMCYYIGEPDREYKRLFAGMVKTMEAGLEMLRPGVLPSQVYQVMAEAQVKNCGGLMGHFGHGIGLEPRDIPLISSIYSPPPARAGEPAMSEDLPLEPGVVLCIETPFRRFEGMTVHAEYTLVITERGWENIIPAERQLLVF